MDFILYPTCFLMNLYTWWAILHSIFLTISWRKIFAYCTIGLCLSAYFKSSWNPLYLFKIQICFMQSTIREEESVVTFHEMLWKNPSKHFGQPCIYKERDYLLKHVSLWGMHYFVRYTTRTVAERGTPGPRPRWTLAHLHRIVLNHDLCLPSVVRAH